MASDERYGVYVGHDALGGAYETPHLVASHATMTEAIAHIRQHHGSIRDHKTGLEYGGYETWLPDWLTADGVEVAAPADMVW